MLELFRAEPKPLFDPLGFLHLALGRAHAAVVAIGTRLAVDLRPRATCAVCLVQRQEAYWAHVGDSRVYHLRGGSVVSRTRDHSHVEQLLRDGSITRRRDPGHPMRNFVECCLGGEADAAGDDDLAARSRSRTATCCWSAPTASGRT